MNKKNTPEIDNAGVKLPPPIIYGTAIVLGFGLEQLWPLDIATTVNLRPLGIGLLILSGALAASGFFQFAKTKTALRPDRPTRTIMTNGPYHFTRNPLYLSLAALQLGISFVTGHGWVALLLIPVLVIITFYVIHREEAYLERKFGNDYLNYKHKVRRWF